MRGGFVWLTKPEKLAQEVEAYAKKALIAVHAAAAFWGDSVQTQMRTQARWQDRTGAARSGLFYAVDGFGLSPMTGQVSGKALAQRRDVATVRGNARTLVVAVGHTVWYGKFLETRFGGRYAIVLSTMQRNLPRLERLVRDVFEG